MFTTTFNRVHLYFGSLKIEFYCTLGPESNHFNNVFIYLYWIDIDRQSYRDHSNNLYCLKRNIIYYFIYISILFKAEYYLLPYIHISILFKAEYYLLPYIYLYCLKRNIINILTLYISILFKGEYYLLLYIYISIMFKGLYYLSPYIYL